MSQMALVRLWRLKLLEVVALYGVETPYYLHQAKLSLFVSYAMIPVSPFMALVELLMYLRICAFLSLILKPDASFFVLTRRESLSTRQAGI